MASPSPSFDNEEASEHWLGIRKQFEPGKDDTAARLRYAQEWERSFSLTNPRSLLIRLQLRLAEIGVDHPEWFRLRSQTEEILLDHEATIIPSWFRELGIRNPVFHRGFIEGCVAPLRVLLMPTERKRLFDFAPIRHLTIEGIKKDDDLGLFFRTPEFRGIVSLAMDRQGLTDQSLESLSIYAPRDLRWLSIRDNQLASDSLEWLSGLRQLQFVDFSGNGAGSEEDVHDDQGVVVSRRPPALAERYPFLRGPMPDRYQLWRLSRTIGTGF